MYNPETPKTQTQTKHIIEI